MLEIKYVPIENITPYKGNAKLHPQSQIEQIMQSIDESGFNDPIAIDEDGTIIEGHGRFIAAEELGMQNVPVIVLRGLSDEQRRAYTLAHNKLTANGNVNLDLLEEELKKTEAIDMAQGK